MFDYPLHRGGKYFCCYCLQAFSTKEILKHHIKDALKLIKISKGLRSFRKVNTLDLKVMKGKKNHLHDLCRF